MSASLGIWHLTLEGGQEKMFETPAAVQITNISFGEEIADANGRTIVKLTFQSLQGDESEEDEEKDEDEEEAGLTVATTVLCALTPGKIEQASVNLVLESDSTFKFEVSGKNTVYLTGNYIQQQSLDQDPFGSDDDSDEDGYDLREVSSDVEMHPDDLDDVESDASRFEEVDDVPAQGQKRPRESDLVGDDTTEKKNKKVKGEKGDAVPVDSTLVPKKDKKEKKKDKKAEEGQKKPEGEKKKEEKNDKAAKKTVAGGIVVQDAKIGTGPMAKKGNTVRMRYVGKLTNGKEFDKNTSGKPFTFHLGKGEVIKGWDEGIVGMQAGGERILTIPPNMGYGKRGQAGIPPNSTLVFEVKLLEIK